MWREIKERLMDSLKEYLSVAEPEKIIKNAYRIYNLLNSIKTLTELEKVEMEQGYEQLKNLVITELMAKYPEIADILKGEIDEEIPV